MGRVRQEGPHQAGVRRRHGRPGGWPQRHRDAPESHEDGQDASSGRYFNFNSFSLASTVGGIWLLNKLFKTLSAVKQISRLFNCVLFGALISNFEWYSPTRPVP